MSYWNRVKIKYQQEQENGTLKTVNEEYLFKAVSFTDAEARTFEHLSNSIKDFIISSVTKARYSDVFDDGESEKWFEAKVVYESFVEKTSKVKRVVSSMLVKAENIDAALVALRNNLANMLIPYEIEEMKLTHLLEVIPD